LICGDHIGGQILTEVYYPGSCNVVHTNIGSTLQGSIFGTGYLRFHLDYGIGSRRELTLKSSHDSGMHTFHAFLLSHRAGLDLAKCSLDFQVLGWVSNL
jgi:hypothetical protein